ncbi:hypothetical protein N7454_010334 [Penicillium verhagenii]|nr:hypothetical protein N7454_010334 [Penicillium verhagenii]
MNADWQKGKWESMSGRDGGGNMGVPIRHDFVRDPSRKLIPTGHQGLNFEGGDKGRGSLL